MARAIQWPLFWAAVICLATGAGLFNWWLILAAAIFVALLWMAWIIERDLP